MIAVAVILLSIVVAWFNPTLAKFCWLLFAITPQAADAIMRFRGRRAGGHSRVR